MQWMIDHWFEIAITALLAVIAINTVENKWNNSTIVERLDDILPCLHWPGEPPHPARSTGA